LLPTASVKDGSGGAVNAEQTEVGWRRTSKQGKHHGAQLHDVMKGLSAMLPTPKGSAAGPDYAKTDRSKTGISLQTAVGMLPTPATRDHKGANGPDHMSKDRPYMDQLPNAITHGTNRGLKLQPAFALWMMGFPEDWCDLEDGE
jgi:hypothetical protein